MGGLLTGGTILAAFFAGAIALFAPCCIVFLFPAYLASAVKNRRWRLVPLTFVFALGLAVVLVPITLGVGILSNTVARFHRPLYLVGGVMLLGLALLALIGRSWSMPRFVRTPSIDGGDTGGMFALGVFSGVASSCCAPVLAGVMTMSALTSSLVGSVMLGLAYVFGMAFPLFLLAVLWDRFRLGERRFMTAKAIRLRIGGRAFATNTMNIAVAVAFALMGAMVLVLAANGNTTAAPGFQRAIGRWLSSVFTTVNAALEPIPEPLLGLALLAVALFFVVVGLRGRSAPSEGGSCHEHQDRPEGFAEEAHAHVEGKADPEATAAR
ncbi:MAG: cytochrome c biogenesis protein CcdA [Actinobacteria bacterium]|nr:cytochrome c biogenesis protein CcdA [Actinomycetota bacterium]